MVQSVTNRRQFLEGSIATTLAALVAGCESTPLGSGSDSTDEEEDDDETEEEEEEDDTPEFEGLTVGDEIEGSITEEAEHDPERESLAEPTPFRVDEEQTVTIHMDSEDFDPYVVVTDSDGHTVAEGDDGGGGFNTEMTESFEPGVYTIWAGSYGRDGTGNYTLHVEPHDADSDQGGDSGPDLRSIELGETRSGYVEESDGRDPEWNDIAEPVEFTLSTSEDVTIRMESNEFDPYVVLTDSNGQTVKERDDSGTDTNTEMDVSLDAGTYTIWAGSLSGDATGPYTLTLERQF